MVGTTSESRAARRREREGVAAHYSRPMRYAVGDVHGHRTEVRAALQATALVDADGKWSGGDAEVWFLGDLMDRGPDGAGVVADVMRWQQEAAESGGRVESVLGNHEVLALGVRRFWDAAVPSEESYDPPPSFAMSWIVNGGQVSDQERFTDEMVEWMAQLPAMARLDDDLVLHADTTDYLRWGGDVDAVNAAIGQVLQCDHLALWWELWAGMTTRYAFLDDDGPTRARALLAATGGSRIVHGHSIIADLRGIQPEDVEGPWSYADGLALAVDGGIYAGGPSLVVPLA